MRMIYVDEAGTSAKEPVSVVVGLLVDPDVHWAPAKYLVGHILATLPEKFREGFVFHATELWNHDRFRDGWDDVARFKFIHDMLAVPTRVGIPISYGAAWRTSKSILGPTSPPLSKAQIDHATAFGLCVSAADSYIRDRGKPSEAASVVCEDCTEMRVNLRAAVGGLITRPFAVPPDWITSANALAIPPPELKIERVADTVHFVGKKDAWFLQFADGIAFGLRRWINGLRGGEGLVQAIVNSPTNIPTKPCGPFSTGIWWQDPPN